MSTAAAFTERDLQAVAPLLMASAGHPGRPVVRWPYLLCVCGKPLFVVEAVSQ